MDVYEWRNSAANVNVEFENVNIKFSPLYTALRSTKLSARSVRIRSFRFHYQIKFYLTSPFFFFGFYEECNEPLTHGTIVLTK